MTNLKLIFAGSGHFGVPTLSALIERGHEIIQVITQPDRPAGRGRQITPTPIALFATERGLPVVRSADINKEDLPAADLLVVIAFGQKIAEHVIHHARLGSVNLHGSILPKFRGAAPVNWAIIAGERETGNSIIRLAQKMDAGAILGQSRLEIGELETAGELHDRLADDGAPLMLRVLDELASGTVIEMQQDHSLATMARKLSRESSAINWRQQAAVIAHQARGMFPWPGCRVRLAQGDRELARLTLARAKQEAEPITSPAEPGTILPDGTIACVDSALRIVEVQPEGKRPMPLEAFRNGHAWPAGARLESIA